MTINFYLDILSPELVNGIINTFLAERLFRREDISTFPDSVTLIDSPDKDIDTATHFVSFQRATVVIARIKTCELSEWADYRRRLFQLLVDHAEKSIGGKSFFDFIKGVDNRIILDIHRSNFAPDFLPKLVGKSLLDSLPAIPNSILSSFSLTSSVAGSEAVFGLNVNVNSKRDNREVVQLVIGYPCQPSSGQSFSTEMLANHWLQMEEAIVKKLSPLLSTAVRRD